MNRPAISLQEYLIPYWSFGTIYRESVLFRKDKNGQPLPAALLYPPDQIISVESSDTGTVYVHGRDYAFHSHVLERLPASSIPCQDYEQLYPPAPIEGHSFPKVGGGNIFFSEGDCFHRMQTLVTYTHSGSWTDTVPRNQSHLLPRTRALLSSGHAPRLLVMGDSITEGANSSGPLHVPPYLGSWWQLAAEGLGRNHSLSVPVHSTAMGGQVSAWGVEQAEATARSFRPDLVWIAFGMNDGSLKVPPEDFRRNIRTIMHIIHGICPATEFVLVASILPNPQAVGFTGFHMENRDMLLSLKQTGTAVADVTAMHQAFLKRKPYPDMTGNHVNHLNDFLARLQAQVMLTTLGEDITPEAV